MSIIFSDNYNRSNNTSLGASYTVPATLFSPAIVSNLCNCGTSGGNAIALYNGTTPNDQGSLVTVAGCASGNYVGAVVRGSTSGDNSYVAFVVALGASQTVQAGKRVSGSFTNLGTTSVAFSSGDTLGLYIVGNQLTVFHNGVLILTPAADATFSSGLAGVLLSSTVSSTQTISNLAVSTPSGSSGEQQMLMGIG
jgi:hypothetical protein